MNAETKSAPRELAYLELLSLTRVERAVLDALIAGYGRVVKRSEITAAVAIADRSNVLEVIVSRLRKKLRIASGGALEIQTTRLVGYSLECKGGSA